VDVFNYMFVVLTLRSIIFFFGSSCDVKIPLSGCKSRLYLVCQARRTIGCSSRLLAPPAALSATIPCIPLKKNSYYSRMLDEVFQ
jgi:hypothetical protein